MKRYRNHGASIYQDTIGPAPGHEITTRWFCSTQCEPGKPPTAEEIADAAEIAAGLNSRGDLLAACEAALKLCQGNGYSQATQKQLAAAIAKAKDGAA